MKTRMKIWNVIPGFIAFMAVGICGLQPPPGVKKFFGLTPPGQEPAKFWADILTAEKHPHGQLAFSPDEKGVFWAAMLQDGPAQTIFYSVFDGRAFSRPAVRRSPSNRSVGRSRREIHAPLLFS